MPVDPLVQERLDAAVRFAREAGRHTLNYFQSSDLAVDRKHDESPVTIADREAEQLLRKAIGEAFPDDAILGEEFGESPGTSGFRWILDPIDGTKSFISGVPLYGTLVGVEREGAPVAGVIEIPALDERAYAAIGGGAFYQRGDSEPTVAAVDREAKLPDGLFVTSEVHRYFTLGRESVFLRLQDACRMTRTWGDCYGYLLVATGRAVVAIDAQMNPWDACALAPVLAEAGGTYTDWTGKPTIYGGDGVATNGTVLDDVLALTRAAPPLPK